MANYYHGNTQYTIRSSGGNRAGSIMDITFRSPQFELYVFPGSLSQNDILVKYKDFNNSNNPRLRTPQHIHWVIDILLKKEHYPVLTNELLTLFLTIWEDTIGLQSRTYDSILQQLNISLNNQIIRRFSPLNEHGYYDIEFLMHLMELLIIQEKTNNPNAYMFRHVTEGLLSSDDIFKIVSTATYNGR